MTKDEIIRMAVQCQLVTTGNRDGVYMDALERFFHMAQAAEREECAKMFESHWRETWTDEQCAEAIRARGAK